MIRGNLPLAVGSTWISNPLTYIPIYYFCYEVGVWMLGAPSDSRGNPIDVQIQGNVDDFQRLAQQLLEVGWDAIGTLLFGCLVMGIICSTSSYVFIRTLWRLHIYRAITRRRERHLQRKEN